MAVDTKAEIEKALQRPQSVSSDGTVVTQRSADDLLKLADRAAANQPDVIGLGSFQVSKPSRLYGPCR